MNNGAAQLQDGRRDAGRCQRESVTAFESQLSAGSTHVWRSQDEIRHPKMSQISC